MTVGRIDAIERLLRNGVLRGDGAGLTDAQLLGRYVDQRDESAFTALVHRHGSMVWGVCRRVLMNHQDAEDAFQATFLVLVRKAKSVHTREKVANWLYGVAYNTALKAKDVGARRKARECQVFEMPESAAACQSLWNDLSPLLDRELSDLPERYRLPIVLCDLEGRTRKEAARQLGWPEGTLSSRLSKARTALAKKLSRHGLGLSVGAIAFAFSQSAAPAALISSTIKAATLFAAGPVAAAGAVSVKAAALTEGVLKDMLMSKLKFATVALLAASFVCMGVSVFRTTAAENAAAPAAAANQKPEDRARVKWEYKAISTTAIGKLAPEKSTDKSTDGLNALGDQGWELVAIQPSTSITAGFGGGALGGGGFLGVGGGALGGGGGIGGGAPGGGGSGGGGLGGGTAAMSKPTIYLFKRPK